MWVEEYEDKSCILFFAKIMEYDPKELPPDIPLILEHLRELQQLINVAIEVIEEAIRECDQFALENTIDELRIRFLEIFRCLHSLGHPQDNTISSTSNLQIRKSIHYYI